MPHEIIPSRKRSREECESRSPSSQCSGSPEKLQQLRRSHGFPVDGTAPSGHQGDHDPSRRTSDKTSSGAPATTTALDPSQPLPNTAAFAARRAQHLERLNKLPFLPSQLRIPLEGQSPSAATTALDPSQPLPDTPALAARRAHLERLNKLPFLPSQLPEGQCSSATTTALDQLQKKASEDMTSKLKSLVNLMKTLTMDKAKQEEIQPMVRVISHMAKATLEGNRVQMQKSYEAILSSIKDLASKDTIAPNIQAACARFLAEVEPQPQEKLYTEHGSTKPEAITRIAKTLLEAARSPELPDGPLGIRLTDDQYKAQGMAYRASAKRRAAQARYQASQKGKETMKRAIQKRREKHASASQAQPPA